MTSGELPLIRVSNPGDLIETVPYLLGFHPIESLVLVGFASTPQGQVQRVTVTMRVDLPADELAGGLLTPLTGAFRSSATDAVVAVVLTEAVAGDPREAPALAGLKQAILRELRTIGLEVLDVLVATGSRWWSLCCERADCCPPLGTPRRPADSAVAAEATYAGLVALPDRESLAATLAGHDEQQRARLGPALAAAEQRLAAATARNGRPRQQRTELGALERAARTPPERTAGRPDRQLARLAVALTDVGVRDAVWLAVDHRSWDAEELLRDLHSRLPSPYDAAALFLFGWGQWRAGNGTLAMMAAERALASDPNYGAAALLISAVQHGLDPRSTPPLERPDEQRPA